MKKCLAVFSVVLAVVAGSSYGMVVGDFEGGLDNWLANDATLSMSTIGATTGTGSMLVEMPVSGWHIDGRIDAKPIRQVLGATTSITADVTVFAADMTTDWMQVEIVINGQNNDDAGVNNNIGWNPLGQMDTPQDGLAHTYTWTVPEALQTKLAGVDDNIWWFEVMLVSNNGGANTKFYVDNVQLVPEPASLSLLGLGALALLRKRK